MHSALTVYITLICTSSVFIVYLGLRVWMKRHHYSAIANYFLVYTAAIAIYCLAAALALTSATLGEMKFWTVVQYIGMPISSPLGLLFIMKYLGIKVTLKRCAALLFLPVITFFMVVTNDWHHLHYHVFEIDPALGLPFIYLEIGPWYAVHGIYIFGCMFIALLLMISQWKETARTYRPQLIALMFGQLVPMVTAFLYLIGLTPSGVDPVPMVMWLTSLLYLWAIRSSSLFAIMPVAKNAIFNSINDGVIVLDGTYRLIDYNEAAKNNFPGLNKSLIGTPVQKLWREVAADERALNLQHTEDVQEVRMVVSGTHKVYQLRIAPLEETKGSLLIFTDMTELKKLQAQLEHQAYYDELTGIHNRRAFLQQAEKELAAARKEGMPFSVILMDIDHFKKVNDTYGHHTGDELLVHVAETCRTELDERNLFARYGGEEFVIALKGFPTTAAVQAGDSMRQQLKTLPFGSETGLIAVTVSMGVSEGTDKTLHQLLHEADTALYEAKEAGRDQVRVYEAAKESVN
ncbi:sensor domain-containing diguanylate cyclase [Planococcus sp. CAU13]|uniref:sensor domain-containing diguanylate cyclase n=1 Tax=Planococcus sp. CAU13 TaxID=1541197 RepID=UPI00052FF920|nr:histidine kinase N-terminal 7TM domain-containing protein [Planococcus sp. CAU13]